VSEERILIGHGSGGLMTRRLVRELFRRHLRGGELAREEDAARVATEGRELAFTTDAFVVDPIFFPGGDIGKLAVCGTVNDLCVAGARPRALSAAFILEEGLPLADLERIAESMAAAAEEAGVEIVAGDTKVVPRGKGDGCYIVTAGVGELVAGVRLGADAARPGDRVLVSGPIGDHGAAVLVVRAGIDLRSPICSDCAPLTELLLPILADPVGVHAMRDPTRGGLATVLCEIAEASEIEILVEESAIPVAAATRAACELLGLDPLYLACEGRAVVVVAPEASGRVLETLSAHPLGRGAAQIGEVRSSERERPRVIARTPFGSHRLIAMLASDPLPRIC
jgi:hydrogenase expression/formation protein HypE